MEITIWCPVCGQVVVGLLNLETGAITATCATCGEVSTNLAP